MTPRASTLPTPTMSNSSSSPPSTTPTPTSTRLSPATRHASSAATAAFVASLVIAGLGTGWWLRREGALPWSGAVVRRFVPESLAAVVIGVVGGGIARGMAANGAANGDDEVEHELAFRPEMFFFLVLPLIVFDAAVRSVRKRLFFRNLQGIVLFAGVGTLVSTLVVGSIVFGFAKAGAVRLDKDNPLQALAFGSLISSVDPVAILAILGDADVNPDLYSLVFGESVLNDAVAISLFLSLIHI